jgi:hypothetical protein
MLVLAILALPLLLLTRPSSAGGVGAPAKERR